MRYDSPVVAFGEVVLGRKSRVPDNRLSSAWSTGIWLGRANETNEHIVGTTTGVIRCRTIKRRPDELQWEIAPFASMVFPPWSPNDLKDVRAEALWTPTAGCQACEDDQATVRRVGRPKKHTPACMQRQSDLKRMRLDGQTGALPSPPPATPAAVQAEPVAAAAAAVAADPVAAEPPQPGAAQAPVQPGPGAASAEAHAAWETTTATRRVAEPVNTPTKRVRWDLWDAVPESVSASSLAAPTAAAAGSANREGQADDDGRSAKNLRTSNSEMTIDLVTDLQPNEEESDELKSKRVFAGRVFTDDEVKKARYAELDRLEEYHAKEDVGRAAVDGPLLSVTWVD